MAVLALLPPKMPEQILTGKQPADMRACRWFLLSERCSQPIAKFAVQFGRPDLHEHARVVERPPHLLLFDHPLADE